MSELTNKEVRLLNKINNELESLAVNLEKMTETDSKVKEFYEQEKAIHNIHVIVRKAKKVEKLEGKAIDKAIDDVIYETESELELAQKIDNDFVKLEETVTKMAESTNKVASFLEQKKALHEARKILKESGLLS
ncbi:hypothetical protein ACWN8P_06125 [Vagococcus salmoninarum]|uniref:Uncharacterized protein n=1 Tax=Vagococcus salmoninarum TaxID=2739 RepID=A0A429ZPY9_9ENTE|nr:hypothetical protein [Vagococcus salmoninarum]RST95745.1 hypothetical protein CBF35_07175 [Vagococcus salmoninarum]